MNTTHAELIEDLAHAACGRLLGRPLGRTAYHAFLVLRDAHEALGNVRLAGAEQWQDDERECAEAGRLSFALAASIREARGLTAAVSG